MMVKSCRRTLHFLVSPPLFFLSNSGWLCKNQYISRCYGLLVPIWPESCSYIIYVLKVFLLFNVHHEERKMISSIIKLIVITALGMAAICANATTYIVDETFTGTFQEYDPGTGQGHYVEDSKIFASLISGDSTLFSSSGFSRVWFRNNPTLTLCPSSSPPCFFTETLKNGDTFHGTINNMYFYLRAANEAEFGGETVISGGTGLFLDATGGGTFSGVNVYKDPVSGTSTSESNFTITTQVPEPKTYTMILAGLGLMGFILHSRKSEQA